MNLAFSITFAILQSALAQMILLAYQLYVTMDLISGVTTTVALLFFVGLYDVILGVIFLRVPAMFKMFIVPFLSSLFTAATLTLYPSLGFAIDFWTILAVLFLAGIFSAALLFSAGASWSDCKE